MLSSKYCSEISKKIISFLNERDDFLDGIDFDINFVSKEEIVSINKKYRGVEEVTDIVTLIWGEKGAKLVQLFIFIGEVINNSEKFTVSLKEELVRVLVHGILHGVGMEHNERYDLRKKNQEQMFVVQERLVKEFLEHYTKIN